MKVSKRDISIVMVLLGIIALFCVYQFYYRDTQTKVEELEKSIKASKAENSELLKIDETKLDNDMKAAEKELKDMILEYPGNYRFDDMIMYLYDLEQNENYGAHFIEYEMRTTSNPESLVNSYLGKIRGKDVSFAAKEAKYIMRFTNDSYEGCKKMLSSVYSDPHAKNFKTVRLWYDNTTGVVNGEIELNAYIVTDHAKLGDGIYGEDTNYRNPYKDEYIEVAIPQVEMGVDCVFGPTVTPVPTLELENPEE